MKSYELIITAPFQAATEEDALEIGSRFAAECALNHDTKFFIRDGKPIISDFTALVREAVPVESPK